MSAPEQQNARREVECAMTANREFFAAGRRITVAKRRVLLRRMLSFLRANRANVFTALQGDLHKSEFEATVTEYLPLVGALRYFLRKLPGLARGKRGHVSWMNLFAGARIVPEPYGQVLVVATWNYPLLLALEPAAGALAAGNRVILKLSPQAGKTGEFLSWMIRECFPNGEITAVRSEFTLDEMLSQRFDYIFFTGSFRGGRGVMSRAAEHLTPVTLELGGKCPCIVDEGAWLAQAARRIVWGKFANAGQTCVAPDYVWIKRELKERFVVEVRRAIDKFYGQVPVDNPDYPWIIGEEHYNRLCALLEHGRLIAGGERNPNRFCIAPTVIDGIGFDDPLMEHEIFGPILPILEFDEFSEVLERISAGEKPLATYCFGGSWRNRRALVARSSSGAVCFDDVVMHFVNDRMPFGGVGASGMGAYHGHYTFDTFSHYKPVMYQSRLVDWPLRYPPFAGIKRLIVEFISKIV